MVMEDGDGPWTMTTDDGDGRWTSGDDDDDDDGDKDDDDDHHHQAAPGLVERGHEVQVDLGGGGAPPLARRCRDPPP